MPHDRDGNRLGVGDTVVVPARVLAIHDSEEYCNVDLETVQPMSPSDMRTFITLNAKQTVLFQPRNASGTFLSKIEKAAYLAGENNERLRWLDAVGIELNTYGDSERGRAADEIRRNAIRAQKPE